MVSEINRLDLIEALKTADWSGASIGNKALIQAAIYELQAAQVETDHYQSLLPKLKTLLDAENSEQLYATWHEQLSDGEKLVWCKVAASKESLLQAYEEARIVHAFKKIGLDKIILSLPLAHEGFSQ